MDPRFSYLTMGGKVLSGWPTRLATVAAGAPELSVLHVLRRPAPLPRRRRPGQLRVRLLRCPLGRGPRHRGVPGPGQPRHRGDPARPPVSPTDRRSSTSTAPSSTPTRPCWPRSSTLGIDRSRVQLGRVLADECADLGVTVEDYLGPLRPDDVVSRSRASTTCWPRSTAGPSAPTSTPSPGASELARLGWHPDGRQLGPGHRQVAGAAARRSWGSRREQVLFVGDTDHDRNVRRRGRGHVRPGRLEPSGRTGAGDLVLSGTRRGARPPRLTDESGRRSREPAAGPRVAGPGLPRSRPGEGRRRSGSFRVLDDDGDRHGSVERQPQRRRPRPRRRPASRRQPAPRRPRSSAAGSRRPLGSPRPRRPDAPRTPRPTSGTGSAAGASGSEDSSAGSLRLGRLVDRQGPPAPRPARAAAASVR